MADAGYFASAQIALAEEKKYEVLVAKSSGEPTAEKGARMGPLSRFPVRLRPRARRLYLSARRIAELSSEESHRKKRKRGPAVSMPGLSGRVLNGGSAARARMAVIIDISIYRDAVERHRKKREVPESKTLLRARKVIIEPVFAWIKSHLDFRRWTVSGLSNVRAQWSLMCATLNLKKLYSHWLTGRLVLTAA